MLILTRKVGESIKIGEDIEITTLAIKGNQVRIGIAAPKHVGVHRQEIYDRIQGERPDELNEENVGDTATGQARGDID